MEWHTRRDLEPKVRRVNAVHQQTVRGVLRTAHCTRPCALWCPCHCSQCGSGCSCQYAVAKCSWMWGARYIPFTEDRLLPSPCSQMFNRRRYYVCSWYPFLHTDCPDGTLECCLPDRYSFQSALPVSLSHSASGVGDVACMSSRCRGRHHAPLHHVGWFRPESLRRAMWSHSVFTRRVGCQAPCARVPSHCDVLAWHYSHTQAVYASWISSVNSIVFCCRLSRASLSFDMRAGLCRRADVPESHGFWTILPGPLPGWQAPLLSSGSRPVASGTTRTEQSGYPHYTSFTSRLRSVRYTCTPCRHENHLKNHWNTSRATAC